MEQIFEKYGWQVASFLGVIGLMGYLVKTLLTYFFKILDRASNHIPANTEVMRGLIDAIKALNGRSAEEHKEILEKIKEGRVKNAKSSGCNSGNPAKLEAQI